MAGMVKTQSLRFPSELLFTGCRKVKKVSLIDLAEDRQKYWRRKVAGAAWEMCISLLQPTRCPRK